jgi:uncharacterized protein (DUF433 family)
MAIAFSTEPIPLTTVDGVIRVTGTRVTLDTIVGAFNDGATAEEIAQAYPSVTLANIYTVLGYYLRRKLSIDQYLQERQRAAATIRHQNEQLFNPIGIRERLLARQMNGKAKFAIYPCNNLL